MYPKWARTQNGPPGLRSAPPGLNGARRPIYGGASAGGMARKKGAKAKLSPVSARTQRLGQLEEAVAWCRLNNKGPKAAIAHGVAEKKWELVTRSSLQRRMSGKVASGHENEARQVLTCKEEKELVEWCVKANEAQQGKTDDEVKEKIIELLRHRNFVNRTSGGGRGFSKLSRAAKTVVRTQHVGGKLLRRIKRKYEDLVDTKNTQKIQARRAEKHSEDVIRRHFYDAAGLEALLLRCGIMDPVTKKIDARRVLNKDETPQFVDYDTTLSGQQKVWTGRGKQAFRAVQETRECQTVDVTWGLDGWQYHLHLVVARKEVSLDFVQPETETFDGTLVRTLFLLQRAGKFIPPGNLQPRFLYSCNDHYRSLSIPVTPQTLKNLREAACQIP